MNEEGKQLCIQLKRVSIKAVSNPPIVIAIQYSEEAFQFCSAAGVIFWDAYRILKLLESFSTGNFNSHFDLYSNECITRLQSLSHLNYQSSFLFPYFNSFPYELCCTTTIELSIPATFFQHSINKYAKMKYF